MDEQPQPSRWRAWLGWSLFALGLLERVIGWGGSIDFIVSRSQDPGWIRGVLTFVESYSAYFGFALILAGVALIVLNERRRYEARLHRHIPAPASEPAPTLGGDTCVATGTVRDATTEEIIERGLYVGEVIIGTAELKKNHRLEITVRGFNGANRILTVADVSGHVIAELPNGRGAKKSVELPTPTIIRSEHESYKKFAEFHVLLHQHVTPAQARAILRALGNERLPLDLDDLKISVTPIGEPGPRVRMPLWNGVTLHPAQGVQTGRIFKAVVTETVRAQAVFGEPPRPEGTEQETQP